MSDIAALQASFGIRGAVEIATAAGSLPAVSISTPRSEALIYLYGAHLTHFQLKGQEPILFLSDKASFGPGKAIRGGIPVIFPWFGASKTDPKAPSHGFARTTPWSLSDTAKHGDGTVTVTLTLSDSPATRALWNHAFKLEYRITVGNALTLELRVHNTGSEPFIFEEALHSYFGVEDVRNITLTGLAGREYLDKTKEMARFSQTTSELKIESETDKHYLATKDTVVIYDPGFDRTISIEKENSQVTVVWNPWIEKAKTFSDMADDEWPEFVCVESANAYDYAVNLAAGAFHTMTTRIS